MASIASLALLLFLSSALQSGSAESDARPPEERLQFLSSMRIPKGSTVAETVCILCSIQVDGAVTEEAVAVWGSVTVSGSVAEEVVAAGGNVRLLAGAHVGSEVVAVGGDVSRDPGAVAEGAITELPYLYFPGQWTLPWPGAPLFAALTWILLWLAPLAIGKTRGGRTKAALVHHPMLAFLMGTGGVVLVGFLAQATPSLGELDDWIDLGWAALLLTPAWLGSSGLSLWLGEQTASSRPALAGSALLVLLFLIPVAGLVASMVSFVVALGTAMLSGFGAVTGWLSKSFRARAKEVSR